MSLCLYVCMCVSVFVCMYICMMYVSMGTHVVQRFFGVHRTTVGTLLALWDSGIQLQPSNLNSKCLYLLSHLTGPWLLMHESLGDELCNYYIFFRYPLYKATLKPKTQTLNFRVLHLCHISSVFFFRQDKKF